MGDLDELAILVDQQRAEGGGAQGLCAGCGYRLRGLPDATCPECGRPFDPHNPATMNLSGRPYGPLARVLFAPPARVLAIAAVCIFLWHGWLAHLPSRPRPAHLFHVHVAWTILLITVGLLMLLRHRAIKRLRPPADLRGSIRSLWLVPVLFILMMSLAGTSLPFRAVFWISRPFLDRFVAEITSQPLRMDYADRSIGLFSATSIHATFDEVAFWFTPTGTGLVYARRPAGEQDPPGLWRTAVIPLGGGWRMVRNSQTTRIAAQYRALEQLADDPALARQQILLLADTLRLPKLAYPHPQEAGLYDTPPRPAWHGTPEIVAHQRPPQPGIFPGLLRPDLRAVIQLGKDAEPLLRQLMNDPLASARLNGVIAAMEIGPEAIGLLPDLVMRLSDADGSVRAFAAAALGALGPSTHPATPALLTALRDSDADVRYNAAVALRRIAPRWEDYPRLFPEVLAELMDDPRTRPSAFATGILAQRATLAHNDPTLTRITNEGTRWQLGQLLAQGHLPPPRPPGDHTARSARRDDPPARRPGEIERQVQEAIDIIETHAGRQPLQPAAVAPVERSRPGNSNWDVDQALRTLRAIGPDAAPAIESLLWLAEVDPYYFMRADIYQVLMRIGPAARPAVPLLLRAMRHPARSNHPAQPAAQVYMMLAREDRELARELMTILPTLPEYQRTQVLQELPRLGPAAEEIMPLLPTLLLHSQSQRQLAIGIIEQIGPPAAPLVPEMEQAMRHNGSVSGHGAAMARALGAIGPIHPRVIPILMGMLDDWPPDQYVAAEVLGSFGPAAIEAVPVLEKHARFDLDWHMRAVCRAALERIRGPAEQAIEPMR